MTKTLSIVLLFIALTISQWDSANASKAGDSNDRRTALRAVANRNKTGHLITKFSADNLSTKPTSKMQVDVRSEWLSQGERSGMRIEGVLIASPSPPENYKFFPGIGYYKNHDNSLNFDAAIKACENEGGHLAVVDSKEEGEALATLGIKHQSYIGAHDRVTEGKFITIFGTPMSTHVPWAPNQPDNYEGSEHCVTVLTSGKLNDVPCNHATTFICEFDLAWAD